MLVRALQALVNALTPDVRTFHVQYDHGGQVYTYRKTVPQMRQVLADRGNHRPPPVSIHVVDEHGDEQPVTL